MNRDGLVPKSWSGAEVCEPQNFVWYISTAVWSVVYIANQTGIWTSCGRHPPNGFTPCFFQSSIIARFFACASSLNFSFSASTSGLSRRIAIVVLIDFHVSGKRSVRRHERHHDDREAPVAERDVVVEEDEEADEDLRDGREEAEVDEVAELRAAAGGLEDVALLRAEEGDLVVRRRSCPERASCGM